MNRVLTGLNFLGVLILVGMCMLQWRVNGQLSHDSDRLEDTRVEQAARIADEDKIIKGNIADLEDARQRLGKSDAGLKDSESKLASAIAERNQIETRRDQLATERDQLKANLDKWIAAVSERDQAIKQAGEQIQKLSNERNDAVSKYNDLAGKYNQAVKDLNSAKAK